MKKKIVARLFRFDVKSDYLSYYKPCEIRVEKETTAEEILKKIQKLDKLFIMDLDTIEYLKINSVCVSKKYPLTKFLETTNEIIIEPIADDFAILDLQIDMTDYMKKLKPFRKFLDESDTEFYKEMAHFYFCSDVRRANKDYLGESIFLLVDRLINKHPQNEVEFLKILADEQDGIFNYGSMCGKFAGIDSKLDEIVLKLKNKIYDYDLSKVVNKHKPELIDKYDYKNEHFFRENLSFKKLNTAKLEGLKVAVYLGNYSCIFRHLDINKIFKENKITVVNTNKKYAYSGIESLLLNPELFDINAGEIIADAIDCDADILVTPWKEMATIMTKRKKQLEWAVGRELKINIIHTTTNLK